MTDRRTDGRTDRRTGKNNMSPDPVGGRHNCYMHSENININYKMQSLDFLFRLLNQRTNGPVNAHLRSAAYTNKHV